MAHGITTTRVVGSRGPEWILEMQRLSDANEITSPRIQAYPIFGRGFDRPIATPNDAREWVRMVADMGVQGIKFFGAAPPIMEAALTKRVNKAFDQPNTTRSWT